MGQRQIGAKFLTHKWIMDRNPYACEKFTALLLYRLCFSAYKHSIARHSYVEEPTIQAVDISTTHQHPDKTMQTNAGNCDITKAGTGDRDHPQVHNTTSKTIAVVFHEYASHIGLCCSRHDHRATRQLMSAIINPSITPQLTASSSPHRWMNGSPCPKLTSMTCRRRLAAAMN